MSESLLTLEEKELLSKAARLMEELIETEVAEDRELVGDIEAALKEAREGKTRPLGDLAKELKLESEVQA
jgi:hypothetical protein